jgi:hypothetical protein
MLNETHQYKVVVYLQIKEVTPKASSSNATQTFWTNDMKVTIFLTISTVIKAELTRRGKGQHAYHILMHPY